MKLFGSMSKGQVVAKVVTGGTSLLAGATLGLSAGEAWGHAVAGVFHAAGKDTPKFGVKHPNRKVLSKGYYMEDPYTGKVKRLSEKKYHMLLSQQPKLKDNLIQYGSYVVILTVSSAIANTVCSVLDAQFAQKGAVEEVGEVVEDALDEAKERHGEVEEVEEKKEKDKDKGKNKKAA